MLQIKSMLIYQTRWSCRHVAPSRSSSDYLLPWSQPKVYGRTMRHAGVYFMAQQAGLVFLSPRRENNQNMTYSLSSSVSFSALSGLETRSCNKGLAAREHPVIFSLTRKHEAILLAQTGNIFRCRELLMCRNMPK